MALTVTVTPGKQFATSEALTVAKLNQLGQPTFTVTGTVSTADISDASVTGAKTVIGSHFYSASVVFGAAIYAVTYTPTPTVTDGTIIAFKADVGNTGATQVSIVGVHTKKIFKNRTQALQNGDIVANQIVEARYDTAGDGGTGAWQMLSQLGTVRSHYQGTVTGTNAIAITLTPPTGHAMVIGDLEGIPIRFKVLNTNTGAVTVQVQIAGVTLAVTKLSKYFNTPLVSGDLTKNQIAEIVYEPASEGFQLQSLPGSPLREVTVPSLARDLIIRNNAAASKVDVIASDIVLRDADKRAYLASTVVLTLDLSGGQNVPLGTDAAAALGWWYIWILYNGTTVTGVLSTSPIAPVLTGLLASYTYKALIGSVYATSGVAFHTFYQAGQQVWLDAEAAANLLFTAKAGSTAYVALAGADLTAFRIATPPIARTVSGVVGSISTAASLQVEVSACKDDGTADTTIGVGGTMVYCAFPAATFNGFASAGPFTVPVRGGSGNYNLQWRTNSATAIYRMFINGYSL